LVDRFAVSIVGIVRRANYEELATDVAPWLQQASTKTQNFAGAKKIPSSICNAYYNLKRCKNKMFFYFLKLVLNSGFYDGSKKVNKTPPSLPYS
jgi:hypothetical protein